MGSRSSDTAKLTFDNFRVYKEKNFKYESKYFYVWKKIYCTFKCKNNKYYWKFL